MDICGECIEQIAEINQKLKNATGKDTCNSIAENGFKALLGVGLVGIDDYDVFLRYKHGDKDIAEQMYHFLKRNLLNTFLILHLFRNFQNPNMRMQS